MQLKVKLPLPPKNPSLPQSETEDGRRDRKAQLELSRKAYRLGIDPTLTLPLLLKKIPERESFSNRYSSERGEASKPVSVNEAIINGRAKELFGSLGGLAEYEELYPALPSPQVMSTWMSDLNFGEQRLSGLDPGMIRRVSSEDELSNVDVEALKAALGGGDLDFPMFMIDYSQELAHVGGGRVSIDLNGMTFNKFCPKPIALFHWVAEPRHEGASADKRGLFLPLAIQIDVKKGSKVFTPASPPLLWTTAKMCFSIADANVHEMSTHLGRHHFALESFGVVTPRQLAPQHPLFILLEPHLKFLVWNNQEGMDKLVQTDGPVDLLLAGTLSESLQIAIKAAKNWSIAEDFEADIDARGVSDGKELPHYPFRDDGLLLWDALFEYVGNYLGIYYDDDAMIQEDHELQAWAAELASTSDTGGHIKDMPTAIESRDQLIGIVTKIIFSLSAGHSAINYSQFPYLSFSPNAALAGYADYREFLADPPDCETEQLKWIAGFLPPHFAAAGQIAITASLSMYHYDKLGDYSKELADPRARRQLYKFVQNLNVIERIIEDRNTRRLVPYRFLLPSEILNGASI